MTSLGILNDNAIKSLARSTEIAMICPFVDEQITVNNFEESAISYGLSSFGYDIRLNSKDFKIVPNWLGLDYSEIDPKSFNNNINNFRTEELIKERYFLIPGNTYALGVSVEKFNIPPNILGYCVGKSTYARSGLIINVTPLEPGWSGYLTLELVNTSPAPIRVYANEGIAQIMFFEGELPTTCYATRKGKYQDQKEQVVFPCLKDPVV
jgi:dCTP deaminase